MARIPEEVVESVVSDVSKRMADPNYAQVAVGSFVQKQPDVSRFLTAHAEDLGGGEAVIHVVFHAEVLAECFRRHRGQSASVIDFVDLDEATTDDLSGTFAKRQPALASYVASNIDDRKARDLLAHVGLALDRA
ncbi:MAG: hypothetical protein AAGF12_35155 [Myxococcota bacterium]